MNSVHKASNDGVMFNAYPDSIGDTLRDTIQMLQRKEFDNAFSLFYILPTFFNSDLDRGFSIIDYDLNRDLVSKEDLKALKKLNIQLKFDIVLNHLSVASPQFKDLLKNGEESKYKDFFINWNTFWEGHGKMNDEGIIIPRNDFLKKLFMRKSGLPILKVPFPDGSTHPYWNTFYQKITYNKISIEDLSLIEELNKEQKEIIIKKVNTAFENNEPINGIDFNVSEEVEKRIIHIINSNCTYLGQMDVNANSELVWDFYKETLAKIKSYGCKVLRLDAFAYLHKEAGQTNFFNIPGTWDYLARIEDIAINNGLKLLPEIHSEYGLGLHKKVAEKGYSIYDFFLPGLIIHTLEKATNRALLEWINEIVENRYQTVNMLGCHDGIPVLDLKGKEINGVYNKGLLADNEIEDIINLILDRGGRVKNLYDSEGSKISYYQVNATYFSALGESEKKLLLARAIQLFVPGTPQIWYLDLFAGKNDYDAVKKAGSDGHKEINRTNLSKSIIEYKLDTDIVKNQLTLIKLRNTSKAFLGNININSSSQNKIDIKWSNKNEFAHLKADLDTCQFSVQYSLDKITKHLSF